MKKLMFLLIYTFAIGLLGNFVYTRYEENKLENKGGFPMAIKNYKKQVDSLAEIFHLHAPYLMSVIMLESSGKKNPKIRFEQKIYDQLRQLQKGEIDKFENLKPEDLKGLSKRNIRGLASSYGPFQIMGYKSFILKIPLDSLKGDKNLYYSIKWIDVTYGDFVRKGDYQDAFHIHNAGEKYPADDVPRTHDPNYVKNGLNYQKYFEQIVYKK